MHTTGENKKEIITFSPAERLVLPSASLAERAPMPIDGKTITQQIKFIKKADT
jgi:hypothetical protein